MQLSNSQAATKCAAPNDVGEDPKKQLSEERKQKRVAKALADFDSKPSAAGVDVEIVAALCNCSVSAIWRRTSRGKFPKPRKVGHATLWNVGELRKLLQGVPA